MMMTTTTLAMMMLMTGMVLAAGVGGCYWWLLVTITVVMTISHQSIIGDASPETSSTIHATTRGRHDISPMCDNAY